MASTRRSCFVAAEGEEEEREDAGIVAGMWMCVTDTSTSSYIRVPTCRYSTGSVGNPQFIQSFWGFSSETQK